MKETKLYDTDYVILDKDNNNIEGFDIVYSTDGMYDFYDLGNKLLKGEKFVKMTKLPIKMQKEFIKLLN
tara:strand:- start:292 stop:498 length:207 start_codon:yes stop_codon:yes gene_type:complete